MDSGPDQTRIYKSMLYTLRTKSWRRIPDYPHDGNTVDSKSSVFVRGALHWLVKINSTMVINSLGLASETYIPASSETRLLIRVLVTTID